MKNSKIKTFTKASLAIAVNLCLINYAYADEANANFKVATTRLPSTKPSSAKATASFAQKAVEQMSSAASAKYIKNPKFAQASTFPLRLQNKLNENPWRSSPKNPIQPHDLACFYGVPSYRTPQKIDANKEPVKITANYVTGDLAEAKKQILTYFGNVQVTQGDRVLNTEKAIYSGVEETITSKGDATYTTGEYTFTTSDDVIHDLKAKTLKSTNTTYVLNGSVISGDAEDMLIDNEEGSKKLKHASLSGCPINKRSWHLEATSIDIDKDAYFADAWNDVLYLGKVPVFYTPYANFPLTNRRKTGLLPPTLEYNQENGFSYTLPIYLNIAPNYDATITPGRDVERGQIYEAQFRYMPFRNFRGEINGVYIPDDPKWTPLNGDHKRWLFNLRNDVNFFKGDLNFHVDFSKVRNDDVTFMSDISEKSAAITDTSLLQQFRTTYSRDNFDTSLEFRKYQQMYSSAATWTVFRPFAILPQVKFNYYDSFNAFSYKVKTEVTRFNLDKMVDNKQINSFRTHIEPYVDYHVYDGYGVNVNVGATGYLTHYDQSDLKYLSPYYVERLGFKKYDDNVTRALYSLRAGAKVTFERQIWDMNHTQTLEPELKYQYIPYRNQDNIALYDTTSRYDDYYTLFSSMRYAGVDRISNLNALTAGLTTRILDGHDKEMMRFGIAQAYNFEDQKVKLYQTDKLNTEGKTPIEATFAAVPFDYWSLHAQVRYAPNNDTFYNYNGSIRYEDNKGYLFGTSYRFYKNKNYLIGSTQQVDLKQFGFEFKIPLGPDWKFFGASYRDLEQSYNIDTKFGLKYEDCCYAVTFLYENYMKMNYSTQKHDKEKLLGIKFELKGLFGINVRGIEDPNGTNTHFIPAVIPANLNR